MLLDEAEGEEETRWRRREEEFEPGVADCMDRRGTVRTERRSRKGVGGVGEPACAVQVWQNSFDDGVSGAGKSWSCEAGE